MPCAGTLHRFKSAKGRGLTLKTPSNGLSVSVITRFEKKRTMATMQKHAAPMIQEWNGYVKTSSNSATTMVRTSRSRVGGMRVRLLAMRSSRCSASLRAISTRRWWETCSAALTDVDRTTVFIRLAKDCSADLSFRLSPSERHSELTTLWVYSATARRIARFESGSRYCAKRRRSFRKVHSRWLASSTAVNCPR